LQRGELGVGVVELVKAGELEVAAGGEEGAEVAAVDELVLVRVVGSAAIVLTCRHELGKPPSAALISSRLQEENSRTT
jgi:hypothetical protein